MCSSIAAHIIGILTVSSVVGWYWNNAVMLSSI